MNKILESLSELEGRTIRRAYGARNGDAEDINRVFLRTTDDCYIGFIGKIVDVSYQKYTGEIEIISKKDMQWDLNNWLEKKLEDLVLCNSCGCKYDNDDVIDNLCLSCRIRKDREEEIEKRREKSKKDKIICPNCDDIVEDNDLFSVYDGCDYCPECTPRCENCDEALNDDYNRETELGCQVCSPE